MKITVPGTKPDFFRAAKKFLHSRFKYIALIGLLGAAFVSGIASYKRVYVPLVKTIQDYTAGTRTIPETIKEIEKNVTNELRMYLENGLPTLYIDLPFEGYQKLLNKRDEALKVGILNTTDADFVDAEVHLSDGPSLEARLRLKGDWTDHLQGDKWSFRIHLKEDGQILHTRQFSVQSPETRRFLFEWAFHQNLIQEGILSPRYEFINVLLNGKLLGIYALEENFAPELIESQGRRQGVFVRFNESLMWENKTTFRSGNALSDGQFLVTNLWNSEITPFQEARIAEDPVLKAQAESAVGLLRAYQTGQLKASEVFDVELFGRFYALSDLWAAAHGWTWHNLRFYYNPITARLEPVPYDNEPFAPGFERQSMVAMFAETGMFNDSEIRAAYARNLQRLSQDGYVDALHAAQKKEQERLRSALKVEFPTYELTVDWNELKERSVILKLELQPVEPVRGYYQVRGLEPGSTESPSLTVDVGNLMILPVEVLGVEANGHRLPDNQTLAVLPPVINPEKADFHLIQVTFGLRGNEGLDKENPKVEILVRLQGLEREFRVALHGSPVPQAAQTGPAPRQPGLEEAIHQHNFLNTTANSHILKVTPGIWNVKGDLILPSITELIVPAGTVLRFEPGAILYTTGVLNLTGEASAPVILTAQQDTWGGIVVISSPQGSEWRYAAVEKTGGIDRSGWSLTGGITFFQSNITLDHVLIGNNHTEDAINVINGQFTFRDSEFAKTFADAFDADFSTGTISNCTFHDIAGDAVDVSGTTATVSNTSMQRIGDKGLSVGENSSVTMLNVNMDTVGIGVASKDLSKVSVYQSVIRKARFAALAAYIKKSVYGPASIEAPDILIFETDKEAVAQTGSTILLRGKPVETVNLDVDLLYQQGVLGN